MNDETITFCWIDKESSADLTLPKYETTDSAGMDVAAAIQDPLTLHPGDRCLVETGLAVEIPSGFEIQVRPRSGLAVKYGLTIINSPGTIDADYRGEIKIGLINLGHENYTIHRGDRIAQLVVAPVVRAKIVVADSLADTKRGSGGFGHTGK
jgi:dUTP pyrophosphatase